MKVLETERLTLRWFGERDAAFVLELVNDPGWIANIGDRGLRTEEAASAWIAERLVASYWRNGHGLWAMERREDGALVGMCGLVDREGLPEIDVGYALVPRHRGQGYAREGARASLEYARDVLGKRRVLAIVKPGNRASIRVLKAIGMTAHGEHRLAGEAGADALFAWEGDARDDVDALASRFFASFGNRGRAPRVAALPSMFTPGAVVSIVKKGAPRGVETCGVRDFVEPRAALLAGGHLRDFEEHEESHETRVDGALAHRSSRYRKSGVRGGERFEGAGRKHFQLVRTERGWKIASLAWEDDE
jgi:RimJ/RimL family protein N-acetyltransferase